MPALSYLVMNFKQLIFEMAGLLLAGALVKFDGYFCTVGKAADRINEADVFVFFDKCEHITALVAAEAMKNLAVRIDVETWRLFLVKRAKREEVSAGSFKREIGANDIHDVTGGANAFERCRRKTSHTPGLTSRRDYGKSISRLNSNPLHRNCDPIENRCSADSPVRLGSAGPSTWV